MSARRRRRPHPAAGPAPDARETTRGPRAERGRPPTLALPAASLASLASLLLAPCTTPAAPTASPGGPAWRVQAPPGPRGHVSIDVTRGTWMSLDVHPSGEAIVFDLLGDIYELRLAGEGAGPEARALTSGMAWDMQPRYSPDGRQIAFVSDRGGGDNIHVMNRDGGGVRPITRERFRLLSSPAWTPDGRFVAARKHFTSWRSLGAGEIWLYDARGPSDGVKMTARKTEQKDLGEPAFSPDGRWLYFSRDVTPGKVFQYDKDPNDGIYAIERLDRRTGRIERVTGGTGGAVRPTPSPDGRLLAFVRRVRARSVLVVRDLQTGAERALYDGLDRDLQETWAIHGVYPSMSFTPDSRAVVLWAGGRIQRVEIAGGRRRVLPFHVRGRRELRPALRFRVEVSPDRFDVKALRWVRTSPDGTKVVFAALGRLWIRGLPDGQPRPLTGDDGVFESHPAWSRDGKTVVYATWHDRLLGSVRTVDVRTGRVRVLRTGRGHFVEPQLSPDGTAVVYRKTRGGWLRTRRHGRDPGLYLLRLGGAPPTRIAREGRLPHFGARADRVFFVRGGGKGKDRALLSVSPFDPLDRGPRVRVTSRFATDLRVSPDGRHLAFREGYQVWVTPLPEIGRPIRVGPKAKGLPAVRVSEDGGSFLHWSGDGRRLWWSMGPRLFSRGVGRALGWLARKRVREAKEGGRRDKGAKRSKGAKGGKGAKGVKGGDGAKLPPAAGRLIAMSFPTDDHGRTLALVGARIITMAGDEVIEDGAIVWRGRRITAVGNRRAVKIPKGAQIIDGRGLTAMPGLIDVHAHGAQGREGLIPQQSWGNLSLLSFGVTTIHDPSNDTHTVFAASELARAGRIVAPRIFSTGTILYGARAAITARIESLEDARAHLRRLKAVGAFSVKSYNQPRRDQRQQILAAARELHMMVVPEGGAVFMHNMTQIVDGHTGVEHALPIAVAYDDVLQLWRGTAVGYTPTLNVAYGGLAGENFWYAHMRVDRHPRLAAFVPRFAIDGRARRPIQAPMEEYNHIAAARLARRLGRAGVGVNLGAHGQREGLGVHWELWSLAQGGMRPLEALRAATLNGARYLGLDGDLGSLQAGKLADIAVVAGRPDERLRDIERVRFTVLGGRVYDAATMNQVAPDRVERPPLFFHLPGEPMSGGAPHARGCGCGLGEG